MYLFQKDVQQKNKVNLCAQLVYLRQFKNLNHTLTPVIWFAVVDTQEVDRFDD